MIELAEDLASAISDALGSDHDFTVAVVAGEYHPLSVCPSVSIWIDTVEDRNERLPQEDCMTITLVTLVYRMDVCYTDPNPNDPTVEAHLEKATEIYGVLDDVWCHLVHLKDTGELLVGECDQVSLGRLAFSQRSGGVVTYRGTVTVQYDCG